MSGASTIRRWAALNRGEHDDPDELEGQSELPETPCSPRRLELRKLKRWPTLARHLQGRMVRIWSSEWMSWWRPGGNGYTTIRREAGIFTFEDALARSRHAGPEKQIEYVEAENNRLGFPPILDACCGGRQFWFDKENPNVLFADCRVMPDKVVGTGKDARTRRCLPDRVHDFRAMEYPDETFQLVVFDPPHLFLGENSFMAQSYGRLDRETWRDDLTRGFGECFRVLKPGGILIFKWNECDVPLAEILKCTPNKPLFGHPSGKAQKTHWCAFWKPNARMSEPRTKDL